jgi:hypothetical protein
MNWLRRWHDSVNQYHIDLINANPTRTPLLDVARRVITEISSSYPPPYHLMVSGGVDSQSMLWLWMNSGVEFIPISIRYTLNDGTIFNDHDLLQLDEFAVKHKLNIDYKNFNILKFLENDLWDYAEKYQCTSPQITTHMAMSEMVTTGTVIFSGNFIAHAVYDYTILGLERYANMSNRNIIPFFLTHDPELASGLIQYEKPNNCIKYASKVLTLQKAGIPVIPQNNKLTGFEKIKDFYDNCHVTGAERIKYANKPSKRNFDIMFRYRLEDKIKYVDKILYHNIGKIQKVFY